MNITEKLEADPQLHSIALTITLPPHLYGLSFAEQLGVTIKPILQVLKKRDIPFRYSTELTSDTQLHYHFHIFQGEWSKKIKYFDNMIHYIRHAFRHLKYVKKIIGFMKFKKVFDRQGWDDYIKKCEDQMEEWYTTQGLFYSK